jgi:hypothetical protein
MGFYPWTANQAAGFPANPYHIVGSDGETAVNPGTTTGVTAYVSALNAFTAASVPTDFPSAKITYTTIDSTGKASFPGAQPGTLVTVRVGNKDGAGEGWTRQIYYAYESTVAYERAWTGSAWSDWAQVIHSTETVSQITAADVHTANDAITAFGSNQITYTRITGAGSSTFPGPSAGTLITYRLATSASDLWARQVYQLYQSNTQYTRYWLGAAWSAWVSSSSVPITQVSADNAYTSADVITGFPAAPSITHTKVNGGNTAGFPLTSAGILTTTRLVSSGGGDVYSRQDFVFYNASVRYSRYWTGSAWSVWQLVDGSITITPLNAVDANAVPTAFAVGVSYTEIDASGKATFPEASAGTLRTERMFYGAEAWTRQAYTIYQSTVVYQRYWTGSAWSAWIVARATSQADSTATDVSGLKADFNTLLAKLRAAGLMSP